MKLFSVLGVLISIVALSGCIKDDFVNDLVDPILRVMNPIDQIQLETTHQFSANYFNNIGVIEMVELEWSSSNPEIISISENGLAEALALGSSIITVTVIESETDYSNSFTLNVTEDEVIIQPITLSGTVNTTSTYVLSGDFTLSETESGVSLQFSSNYTATTALPGLYVYLTNNPNSVSGAFEIGEVATFSGAHSYELTGVGINDFSHVLYFCAPFNIKVGDGEINQQ